MKSGETERAAREGGGGARKKGEKMGKKYSERERKTNTNKGRKNVEARMKFGGEFE